MSKNPAVQPLTMSAAAAGRFLGLGKSKTLALIHSGRLPASILDERIRVTRADCEAFIASLPKIEPTTPQSNAA